MQGTLKELINTFPRPGHIDWISIRPKRRGDVKVVTEVEVSEQNGLIGDHYSGRSGNRHVTLIQAEHLPVVASMVELESIDPALLRRNLVVSGLNLLALKDHLVKIGTEVVLQITGHCHPCSRMEVNLGAGGYNAMRGHGGLTARVVQGGVIRLGDEVIAVPNASPMNSENA
ncbi:MOSC domain-containing protein [Tellurirhabdus bombi]|uniref:MOSC domain-containing protein n=1 Tax=Tellurirhabdus bombi TaxID=2907205 RepID=UPI001F32D438|nr:MOSC domain-containing protein [Tellurirhabdus bombi]